MAIKETARIAELTAKGLTSRKDISVVVERMPAGHGIIFEVADLNGGAPERFAAHADNVINTMRNVVIGAGKARLCIVEHFLCAASLYGLNDLLVKVSGPEMPLGDGSSAMWFDMFEKAGWQPADTQATITLPEPITLTKGDRVLMAIPDETFSVSYLMDWNHPLIGKRWHTWAPPMSPLEIARARTFGSLQEHQMLGIADEVVSMTADGFTQPLHWPDEPVRHKLLDLVGDLALSGVNPLSWKARFISIKAGHELDVEMAKKLAKFVR